MNTGQRVPALAVELVSLARRLSLRDVPEDVLNRVKAHVLDQIGVQLLGASLPGTMAVRTYVERFGASGDCTITGTAMRRDAEYASLLNATFGHGFEMDDYAPGAFTHPGCETIPAALAVAEEVNATGGDLLLAVTLGVETAVRLGLVTQPSMLLDRGFHQNCIHAVIASSLAVGLLRRLPQDEHVMALAIGASHASGTTEYSQSGGDVKRMHAGLGAMGAIRAVRLAELGFTGPRTILEGRRGIFQAFAANYKAERLLEKWGDRWEFVRYAAIKPHCCVSTIHGHIEALQLLLREHRVRASEVDELILGVDPLTKVHAGSIGPEPKDLVAAQFSAEFSLALNFVKGANGLREYREAEARRFQDPEVLELSRRVSIVEDEECAAEWPDAWLGKVTLHLKDGRQLSASAYGKGTPQNPMTLDEIVRKFQDVAGERVSPSRAEDIASAVMGLERLPSVGDLTRLLTVN